MKILAYSNTQYPFVQSYTIGKVPRNIIMCKTTENNFDSDSMIPYVPFKFAAITKRGQQVVWLTTHNVIYQFVCSWKCTRVEVGITKLSTSTKHNHACIPKHLDKAMPLYAIG